MIKLNDSLVFEHDGKRINTSAKSGTKFYAQYVSVIGQEKRHIVKCRGFDSWQRKFVYFQAVNGLRLKAKEKALLFVHQGGENK